MKLNKEWHSTHKIPKNATIEQRIKWHTEHLKNCQCRTDFLEEFKTEMKKRQITK